MLNCGTGQENYYLVKGGNEAFVEFNNDLASRLLRLMAVRHVQFIGDICVGGTELSSVHASSAHSTSSERKAGER